MDTLLTPVAAGTEGAELTSDGAYLQALLDAEAALARAQSRLGLVPPAAAAVITAAARAEYVDLAALATDARAGGNPVIPLVPALRAAVAATDPAAAEYVHLGATSQDVLDTATMLVAVRVLRVLARELDRTAAGLRRLAAAYRDLPAVARTLTQHAVPTTFGLRAAGWYELVAVAADRVRALAPTLPVSLGGAGGTLAGYVERARLRDPDLDVAAFADGLVAAYAAETGLAEPVLPWHVLRVPVADLGATLALATGALGKLALDVQTLSRTEVAEVVEPGRGGSSAMPHKRNPALATLLLSAALQVPAQATVLAQGLLAQDERPAGSWHAEWPALRSCLRLAAGAAATAAELAEGLTVRPERVRADLALTGPEVVSERLAAVLGRDAAAAVLGSDRPPAEVLAERGLPAERVADLLDPGRYLGAAGHLVDRALARRDG